MEIHQKFAILVSYAFVHCNRQFAPAFLWALDFKPETSGDNPCLEALVLLKALNAANKRTLPADAPTELMPKALQRFIRDQNGKPEKLTVS